MKLVFEGARWIISLIFKRNYVQLKFCLKEKHLEKQDTNQPMKRKRQRRGDLIERWQTITEIRKDISQINYNKLYSIIHSYDNLIEEGYWFGQISDTAQSDFTA